MQIMKSLVLVSILLLVSCSTPLYIGTKSKYSELNESQKYKISGSLEKDMFSFITGVGLSTAVRLDSTFTVGGNYTYGNRKYSDGNNDFLYKTNGHTFDFDIGIQPLKKGRNFIMELHAGAGLGSIHNINYDNNMLNDFSNFKYQKFIGEIDLGLRTDSGKFEILFPISYSFFYFNDVDYLYSDNAETLECCPYLNVSSFGILTGFTEENLRINVFGSYNFGVNNNHFNLTNILNMGIEITVYDFFDKKKEVEKTFFN